MDGLLVDFSHFDVEKGARGVWLKTKGWPLAPNTGVTLAAWQCWVEGNVEENPERMTENSHFTEMGFRKLTSGEGVSDDDCKRETWEENRVEL